MLQVLEIWFVVGLDRGVRGGGLGEGRRWRGSVDNGVFITSGKFRKRGVEFGIYEIMISFCT